MPRRRARYNRRVFASRFIPAAALAVMALVPAPSVRAQQPVSFPTQDGGSICAELYGTGPKAVVLAHGGRFHKESWRPQAEVLAAKGWRVLAFDFRGFGCSTGPGDKDMYTAPMENDVLAAVRYLKQTYGVPAVSVIGGSFGASATADASIKSHPGEIDRIVLLAGGPNLPAEQIKSRSLFIVARDDSNGAGPRLPAIRAQYLRAPQPKELVILNGSAHAQFLFQTRESGRVMQRILRFLSRP